MLVQFLCEAVEFVCIFIYLALNTVGCKYLRRVVRCVVIVNFAFNLIHVSFANYLFANYLFCIKVDKEFVFCIVCPFDCTWLGPCSLLAFLEKQKQDLKV